MRSSAYRRDSVDGLISAIKALSDETRIRMLNLLLQRECCVCEVMQVLDISQTRASRNLSILHNTGFLKLRKEGLWAYYSIDKASLEDYLFPLLEAVEIGLKYLPVAVQDKERLQKANRKGPVYCKNAK
jgi:ArsR family transcriptional regulator